MTDYLGFQTITGREAVAYSYDPDGRQFDCPLDWPGMALHSIAVDSDPRINRDYYERNTSDVEHAIIRHATSPQAAASNLERHWKRRNLTTTTITLDDRSNWVTLVIALDANKYGRADAFAANCIIPWWEGDVYVIEHLCRTTWTSGDGRTCDEWETVDAIGGVYLAGGDWVAVAREQFGL